jgi:hypothetical protein
MTLVTTRTLAGVVALVTCLTACAAGPNLSTKDTASATAATATPRPAATSAATTTAATTTAATSQPPQPPGPLILTTADNGTTVRLHPHQTVTVILAAHGMFSWHIPTATGTSATLVNAQGGYPAGRPAQATFVAVRPGNTLLTATDDTACRHAQPACLPPQQSWQATVIVT